MKRKKTLIIKMKMNLDINYKTLKIVGQTAIVMLIATTLFYINLKPATYKAIVEYNENAILYKYKGDKYYGIDIPSEVTLYFVDSIDNIREDIFDLIFSREDSITRARYNDKKKEIRILSKYSVNTKKKILRHELAHYDYHNILTKAAKEEIETKYTYFCNGGSEFYAYVIQDYDEFNYNYS